MESPCNNCPEKQLYARMFDIHFSGADCPYECEKYERYLRSSKEDAYAASAGCTDGGADGELRPDPRAEQSPVYCGKEGWRQGSDHNRECL